MCIHTFNVSRDESLTINASGFSYREMTEPLNEFPIRIQSKKKFELAIRMDGMTVRCNVKDVTIVAGINSKIILVLDDEEIEIDLPLDDGSIILEMHII